MKKDQLNPQLVDLMNINQFFLLVILKMQEFIDPAFFV